MKLSEGQQLWPNSCGLLYAGNKGITMKLSEGQQLWRVPPRWSGNEKPGYVTVLKVGRKWAQLSNRRRIDLATLVEEADYTGSRAEYYPTRDAYDEEVAKQKAWSNLLAYMGRANVVALHDVTVADIEAAGKLLGLKTI